MARTKKEIMKLHRARPRQEVKASIYELDGRKVAPSFDLSLIEDTSGFYKLLKLKAASGDDSPWLRDLQGADRVVIQYFDMDLKIVLPKTGRRPEIKIDMDYGDLCDLVTAFNAMEYIYKKQTGRIGKTRVKMGKIKTRRIK